MPSRNAIFSNEKRGELAVLGLLACVGLGLASAHDEGMFAMVFAVEAAWAAAEAAFAIGSG
jgi:hypothetical protein